MSKQNYEQVDRADVIEEIQQVLLEASNEDLETIHNTICDNQVEWTGPTEEDMFTLHHVS